MGWVLAEIDLLFRNISLNNKKIKIKDCLETGKFPVVDQGKQLISGFYNNEQFVINKDSDNLIIFGDHTRCVKWINFPFVAGADGIKVLKPNSLINERFFYHHICAIDLKDRGYGRHFGLLQKSIFSLTPKAEQDHIATLLDNHLSQVAKIEQKLKDIFPIIKQFRQSVLAQAVSGKLLADLDFENWATVKLSDISQIKGGKRLPKGHELLSEKTPYPYIRVTDFDNASVNLDNLKYLSEETHNLIKNYTISKNDLYISIAGTIGLVGEIPEVLDGANLTENSAKICDIKPEVSKDFLKLCLNSYQIKEQFDDKVTSSGQPKLALFRIRDCVIPLPPLTEQQQIVAEVERLFAVADSIETQVKEALERVGHLTQSILHQAFTGNLSADWRKENAELITGEHSATALLAQIKQAEPKSPRKKKTQ